MESPTAEKPANTIQKMAKVALEEIRANAGENATLETIAIVTAAYLTGVAYRGPLNLATGEHALARKAAERQHEPYSIGEG